MPRPLIALFSLAVFASLPLHAQSRSYIGSFSSRWKTQGLHGHDQPQCSPPRRYELDGGKIILIDSPDCGPSDFARGNLDNSIGFRLGRERDVAAWGPLRLVGGVEGSISHTEYNLSQADFALISGALVGGGDVSVAGIRTGVRTGLGAFMTTTHFGGLHSFREVHFTLPLRPGASVRISRRVSREDRPRADVGVLAAYYPDLKPKTEAVETSLMFVATPEATRETSWDFAATSGTTTPGIGGRGLGLHSAAFQRLSVFRDLGKTRKTQLALSWTSSAHESNYFSTYLGYEGNQRGKTINGFSVEALRTMRLPWSFTLQAGGGFEVADWRDPHRLLVENGGEKVVQGGIELALAARASLRREIARGIAADATFEQLRWRSIGLGEARWSFGIVLTH